MVVLRGASLAVNACHISGVLRDGREHACVLPTLGDSGGDSGGGGGGGGGGDALVGTELAGGWWVKTKIPSAAAYLLSKGEGRYVQYRVRHT